MMDFLLLSLTDINNFFLFGQNFGFWGVNFGFDHKLCIFAKNNENWANMIILIEYYGFLTEMMDGTENAEFETKITESQ